MNTNSNTYTIIYSTVLVVIVAAVLAFAAEFLKPLQEKNVKVETITKVLTAALQADEKLSIAEDAEDTDIMKMYAQYINKAFFINANGDVVKDMNLGKDNINNIQVTKISDLKAQNDLMKAGKADQLNLPVYQFDINGKAITVIPCYGAGLWGPIWGYVAIGADGKTIEGAVFDHKGETPGLGAKIAEEPFYSKFQGKVIDFTSDSELFGVIKGKTEKANEVDAISGATITSKALGTSLNVWFKAYNRYFKNQTAAVDVQKCEIIECCAVNTAETNNENTQEEK